MDTKSANSLKNKLGLTDGMSTYFLRAPQEYFKELGFRQAPYNDNTGEYDFMHAFFTDKDEMSNFADILVSKLAHGGIMWISWPKVSANIDKIDVLSEAIVKETFSTLNLEVSGERTITKDWLGSKMVWKNI